MRYRTGQDSDGTKASGSVLFSFQPPTTFSPLTEPGVTVIRQLDYETTTAYQLTVNATTKIRYALSSLVNLAILITDVQDMNPIFTNLPYSTNLEENVPVVRLLLFYLQ
ncbi:hypothetical protein DPEC_G00362160 [Dallia pectoralis]|nr:hypothetical protein DPEC_G00362160 [Dallia pectoralis]